MAPTVEALPPEVVARMDWLHDVGVDAGPAHLHEPRIVVTCRQCGQPAVYCLPDDLTLREDRTDTWRCLAHRGVR